MQLAVPGILNLLASSGRNICFRYPFVHFTYSPHTLMPSTIAPNKCSAPPQLLVSDSGANQYPRVLTFAIAERHLKPRQLELDFLPRNSHKSRGGPPRISQRRVQLIKRSALHWECQRKFGNVMLRFANAAFGHAAVSSTWERHLKSTI